MVLVLLMKNQFWAMEKYASIKVSITVTEVDPYDATEVFKNGGFRGVVKSLRKGMNLEED